MRGISRAPLPERDKRTMQPPESKTEIGKTAVKKEHESEQSVAGKLLIELGPLLVFHG